VKGSSVVEQCHEVSLNFGPIIVLLALALAMLWPDLQSLELFGAVKLERRVEKAEAKLDGLVLQLSATQSMTNEWHWHLPAGVPNPPDNLDEVLDQKTAQFVAAKTEDSSQ
jgi:hypothetical protein